MIALPGYQISLTSCGRIATVYSNLQYSYTCTYIWSCLIAVSYLFFIVVIIKFYIAIFITTGSNGDCTNGDVRVLNGSASYEGRVEVCVNGEWSTVCGDSWGYNEAYVVCNQTGYGNTSKNDIYIYYLCFNSSAQQDTHVY